MQGEVTVGHAPKGPLYAALTLEERFDAMASLCARHWEVANGPIKALPRSEWPGEVFELTARKGGTI